MKLFIPPAYNAGGYSQRVGVNVVRPSVRPSVIIFVSGAELENRSEYFNETW